MSSSPSPSREPRIARLDFDANRTARSNMSRNSRRSLLDDDVSLMDEVAAGIIERDRKRMRREVTRTLSFVCAVLSCLCAGSITSFSLYGPRFLTDLHYTQYQVNAISIAGELGMYLLVPFFGYLCDRYSPPPLSFIGAVLFGLGYFLAAFAYRSGPPPGAHHGGTGWPWWVMVIAFVSIGAATNCMYMSAVATCAKNFSKSKYRGFMLAVPIAALGLSGMWQSQIGAQFLSERLPDGRKGNVDVFRYFMFLAGLLIAVGVIGVFGLRIVNEEEIIEHKIEELERSGLLEDSAFFNRPDGYGTVASNGDVEAADASEDEEEDLSQSLILKKREEEELHQQRKTMLLNLETRVFLSDRTMWLLAAGLFLVTGPGEAYINNFGTIIPALTPPKYFDISSPPAGQASTHVSIIAVTSTFARLFTGTLSDLFSPSSNPDDPPSTHVRFSRLVLLLPSAFLLFLSFLNLALPFLTPSTPSLFLLSSALVGLGYGATFSLVPIIISVVWGVENFATNWGIVATMPAGGAALWSIIYSVAYSNAANAHPPNPRLGDGVCVGYDCYSSWAWGCAASVLVAIGLWVLAWRVWIRRKVAV